jgi:hypothetical protein
MAKILTKLDAHPHLQALVFALRHGIAQIDYLRERAPRRRTRRRPQD